ncbi:Uncharacterised protein [Escherichia coli]|uniref:Uncharacterized protein n=1 Tax=Escherichia coli TaxID=562 RepID=A0A376KIA7_ECOLX|nr:Uncharacterised protein [Escherichia coli]
MLLHLAESQKIESERLANTLSATYRESGSQFADQVSGAIENSLKSPLDKNCRCGSDRQRRSKQHGTKHAAGCTDRVYGETRHHLWVSSLQTSTKWMRQTVGAISDHANRFLRVITGHASGERRFPPGQRAAHRANCYPEDELWPASSTGWALNDMAHQPSRPQWRKLGAEGEGAGERIARQLEKMFADSEAREKAQAEHMAAFVEAIQKSVQQGQSATMEKMAASVGALGEQLGSLFGQIDKGQQQISATQQANQQSLHEQTQRVMSEVDDQIKQLVETVASQHQGTTETLRLLAEQTNLQIQDMQAGADKMRLAAERFEHAGERVSEANHLTADVLNKAQSAGSSLSLATSELTSVVADYRNNREAVSKSIAMLELLAANTQSEQTTRNQFIADS